MVSWPRCDGCGYRWIAPLVLVAWYVLLNLATMASLTFLPPPGQPPVPPPPEEPEYVLAEPATGEAAAARPAAGEGGTGTAVNATVMVHVPKVRWDEWILDQWGEQRVW
jgi:hypothetical protein